MSYDVFKFLSVSLINCKSIDNRENIKSLVARLRKAKAADEFSACFAVSLRSLKKILLQSLLKMHLPPFQPNRPRKMKLDHLIHRNQQKVKLVCYPTVSSSLTELLLPTAMTKVIIARRLLCVAALKHRLMTQLS